MNIRGLAPQITSPLQEARPVSRVERTIKSDESHDRDANGQQQFEQKDQQHRPMSEEQLKEAVSALEALPAFKEHKWTVEVVIENGAKFVLVKDNLGSVIRMIPELELWTLPMDSFSKGQIFSKSA